MSFGQLVTSNQLVDFSQVLPHANQNLDFERERNRDLLKTWRRKLSLENDKGLKKSVRIITQANIEIGRLSRYFDIHRDAVIRHTQKNVHMQKIQQEKFIPTSALVYAEKMLTKVQARDYPNRDKEIIKWAKKVRSLGGKINQGNNNKSEIVNKKKDSINKIEIMKSPLNIDREIQLAKQRGERYAYGVLSHGSYQHGYDNSKYNEKLKRQKFKGSDSDIIKIYELEEVLISQIKSPLLGKKLFEKFRNVNSNLIPLGEIRGLNNLADLQQQIEYDIELKKDAIKMQNEMRLSEIERGRKKIKDTYYPFGNGIAKCDPKTQYCD